MLDPSQNFADFAKAAYEYAKCSPPMPRKRADRHCPRPEKPTRDLPDLVLPWSCYQDAIAMEIVGDNELVIKWLNGEAMLASRSRQEQVEKLNVQLASVWRSGRIAPRTPSAP